jgi:hypothetical protein
MTVRLSPHHLMLVQWVLLLTICTFGITGHASAVTRFLDRSLLIFNGSPGVTTDYQVSLTYNTLATVGSIDMLFCKDPIPQDPCDPPAGLDVSGATLSDQQGNTGYSVVAVSSYHLILTRTPAMVDGTPSSYTLSGIVNPTEIAAYSIRLSDYASSNATGAVIDRGGVVTQVNVAIQIATQVPPMLVFCVGGTVEDNCAGSNGSNFADLGTIDDENNTTLYSNSQMAAGTNASNGYVITANGTTMVAGTHQIDPIPAPTFSTPGNNQFGINLVANTEPNTGADPDLGGLTAYPAPNYSTPNMFMYKDGDVVAEAPHVSLMRRFTVTYVINTSPLLHPGVYTTTITYIATGRF